METDFSSWQALMLSFILGWVVASSLFDLTKRIRSWVQPWVGRQVLAETPSILRIQKLQHPFLDKLFTVVSCVVSVPFYTGFLPILFWSGHGRLARQMTLLMAFCDYIGNCIKDLVSAPRPSSPPVRRLTVTDDEKQHAMEYGLPSSHALNTVCLTGYFLHYVVTSGGPIDAITIAVMFATVFLLVTLVAIGRIYLGMHSLIDVGAGITFGLLILAFWLSVHDYVDNFIISGQNVASFSTCLSFLLCFAYPTPEIPTPSFEFHAAFTGVAYGIIVGLQQTYHIYDPESPRIFTAQLPLLIFLGRVLVGIATILTVKFCSKAIAKWLLPVVCNTFGIPIVSSCYVPSLKASENAKNKPENIGYLQRVFSLFPQKVYDVDTGIRFIQYAGLAWSVVDLAPTVFRYFSL
ncbi:phosphatidic acid phosphatase (PAP2) family protein [Carex rostrata]